MQTRAWLLVPAALLAAVVACGGGNAASSNAPAADATDAPGYQQAPAQVPAPVPVQGEEEEPLTGDLKQRAEQAALAAYPGTVLKSEYDAERPGLYAVEIRQANGQTVEVYLDQGFAVAGTKNEGQDEGQGSNQDSGQGDGDGT